MKTMTMITVIASLMALSGTAFGADCFKASQDYARQVAKDSNSGSEPADLKMSTYDDLNSHKTVTLFTYSLSVPSNPVGLQVLTQIGEATVIDDNTCTPAGGNSGTAQ